VAATHEFEQAVEKLPDISGADEMLEAKIANAAAEKNPEIFIVEHVKTGAPKLKQSVTPRMEGTRLEALDGRPLQFGANAGQHLGCGIVGVGEGDDFVGAGVTFADEVGHSLHENRSLPRASAGDDQHGAVNVFDGLALAFIGNDLRKGDLGCSGLGRGQNGYGHGKVSSGRIPEVVVEGAPNRFNFWVVDNTQAVQMRRSFASLRTIKHIGGGELVLL